LNVKNRIRSLSLGEDNPILSILRNRFSRSDGGEKILRIKRVFGWRTCHVVLGQLNVLIPPPPQITQRSERSGLQEFG
jgi:hypothetical protein